MIKFHYGFGWGDFLTSIHCIRRSVPESCFYSLLIIIILFITENNKIHEYFLTISGVSCNFLNLYSQNCCFNGILTFWSHKNCREQFLQYTYLKMGNLCLKVKSSALNTHPIVQAVQVSKWDCMRPHFLTRSLPV